MKVSPEYLIQLSHRVNTLHRERKVVENPSEKGQGNIVNPQGNIVGPGQRTGLILLYVC